MLSVIEEMAIHVVFGLLLRAVKNPGKANAMRSILLSLRDEIDSTFGDSGTLGPHVSKLS